MPHEPTREAASARQRVETASAFARREMLAEARQALQGARNALALRGDVGTAHWCGACLVALEIAARGGDVPELEAEAAQLRSLSGGGRYWMEQARARVGEHANRIDPARLDHVLAVLAGEAAPAAPQRGHPPTSEAANPDDAHRPPPAPEPLALSLASCVPTTTENEVRTQPVASFPSDSDMPAPSAGDTRRPTCAQPSSEQYAAPSTVEELDTAGINLPDAPPPFSLATAHCPEILGAAPKPKAATTHLPQAINGGVILVVLALSALLWASRSTAGVSATLSSISAFAAEHALSPGNTGRALQTASALGGAGEAVPHEHLVLGRALLAAGDTAGAVAAFARAAQTDSRGPIAWTAAETLARLPGHSASAADAYLLAFAAGLPAERAQTVARAQELAGRPERAQRVRDLSVAR